MNSKKIEIEVPNGKKAEWVNDVLTLVDEKPVDVRERIKTFEDACRELGENNTMVVLYRQITNAEREPLAPLLSNKDVIAFLKLRIITAALNEGWEPKFTEDEYRYFPWFCLYTQEEIDEMSEDDKSRVVYRSVHSASANGGVAYAGTSSVSASTFACIGSRLAFKTRELAEYAGRQFTKIYADFNFKPE